MIPPSVRAAKPSGFRGVALVLSPSLVHAFAETSPILSLRWIVQKTAFLLGRSRQNAAEEKSVAVGNRSEGWGFYGNGIDKGLRCASILSNCGLCCWEPAAKAAEQHAKTIEKRTRIAMNDEQGSLHRMQAMYEAYPYPPHDGKSALLEETLGDTLEQIDQDVFGGRLRSRGQIRVLIAGGGTGAATTYIAHQLQNAGLIFEVVYLDLSDASLTIARRRAEKLDVAERIRFVQGSLLDLERLDLGLFDFISCSGVVHHLDKPVQGVHSLAQALKADGGICLMVYGALGRTGVYPMQQMLRAIAPDSLPFAKRIRTARHLLRQLPPTNWLNRHMMPFEAPDDSRLVDLFLHPRDVAYQIPALFRLLETAGLNFRSFALPALYSMRTYTSDATVLAVVSTLQPMEQYAFAENFIGAIKTHIVYAVRPGGVHAALTVATPGMALVWRHSTPAFPLPEKGPATVALRRDPLMRNVTLSTATLAALRNIDGRRSLTDLCPPHDLEEVRRVLGDLGDFGYVFTRQPPDSST
ncbi:MAG: class I SAM-dependent methyltransferase [Proteobacteria bacterium]|nr:class I SAM-dependent methyltransferase [Pseudomonadota bacterium]